MRRRTASGMGWRTGTTTGVLAVWAAIVGGVVPTQAADKGPIEIIAHRGASHDAPENTLAALRLGFEQASDAGELDVWVSRDGRPVVIHDADTKRVAGVDKKVADQTFDELRQLDVGRWKSPRYAGERIPSLAEALATIPDGKRMFVEIKCGVEGVPAILREIRESAKPAAQTPIISFKSDVVAAVKRERPDLAAYWIVSMKEDKQGRRPSVEWLIERAQEIRADGLDLSDSPTIDAAFIAQVRAAGLKFYVWTIDDADLGRRFAELGVDGITTNRPAWLREEIGVREVVGGK
ncbi:MAG: glycerophosphodiester phosphodiesterase [Pirellulales bacterium]